MTDTSIKFSFREQSALWRETDLLQGINASQHFLEKSTSLKPRGLFLWEAPGSWDFPSTCLGSPNDAPDPLRPSAEQRRLVKPHGHLSAGPMGSHR